MNAPCDQIRSRFDLFLTKDIGKKEKSEVKRHLKRCADCRKAFWIEKEMVKNFVHLPELTCSDKLLQKIKAETWGSQGKKSFFDELHLFFQYRHWRIISAGVAVGVVIFLVLRNPSIHEEPINSASYTQEEILEARDQARWSLTYVSSTIHKNEKRAVEDLLIDRLPKIVRDCIRNTVPLFRGGSQ